MDALTPCSHPDSNVTLLLRERALRLSPAYVPDTSLRDEIPVSRRSLLIVALAGAIAGVAWAAWPGG